MLLRLLEVVDAVVIVREFPSSPPSNCYCCCFGRRLQPTVMEVWWPTGGCGKRRWRHFGRPTGGQWSARRRDLPTKRQRRRGTVKMPPAEQDSVEEDGSAAEEVDGVVVEQAPLDPEHFFNEWRSQKFPKI